MSADDVTQQEKTVVTVFPDPAPTMLAPAVAPAPDRDEDPPARTAVPPAFYSDDEPPEPPEGDPHWREFPLFDAMKGSRLVVAGIVVAVLFACLVHMLVLL